MDTLQELEKLVDASSLLSVLTALELMCLEKAEHIRVNWQDKTAAKAWDKDAKLIYSVLKRIQN
jgi:hypothetical protein